MSVKAPGTRWYNAVWRWHFYAGLFCVPFVIWLALTGTIYLWRPQIEGWLDGRYDQIASAGPRATAEAQVEAAVRAVPGATFHKYILPQTERQATRVLVTAGGEDRRVYLDPQTLHVLHIETEEQRPLRVVMRMHGQLLVGDVGSYLVEIAACWAVVMLLTGIYLWWPRGGRSLAGVLYPRLRAGRVFWRDMHAVSGIWVSVLALGLILTGLPWAKAWGSYLDEARQLTGTTDGPVDWTIGGKAQPATHDPMLGIHAGHQAMTMPPPSAGAGELDRVVAAARAQGLAAPVLVMAPARPGGPWTAVSDAANRPQRAEVEIDGASGRVIGRMGFAQRHWIDRAIGYGIAVHEGALFGLLNQLLGTATALLLVVLSVSGVVMWWRRRPGGRLGAPLPLSRPRFAPALVAAIAALALAMPLFGATLLVVLGLERGVLRRSPGARRWLGLRAA